MVAGTAAGRRNLAALGPVDNILGLTLPRRLSCLETVDFCEAKVNTQKIFAFKRSVLVG